MMNQAQLIFELSVTALQLDDIDFDEYTIANALKLVKHEYTDQSDNKYLVLLDNSMLIIDDIDGNVQPLAPKTNNLGV